MDQLEKVGKKLLGSQIEDSLMEYILNEPVAIGEKLPNEFELAEKFGVGRSTIREAVKSLVSKGVLEVRRGSGTYVVSTSSLEEDPLGLGRFEDKYHLALELFEVRLMLEPEIAALASEYASEEEKAQLEALCDQVERQYTAGINHIKKDIEFHTCIAECSGNPIILSMLTTIRNFLKRVSGTGMVDAEQLQAVVEEHQKLYGAIISGNVDAATQTMMKHLAASMARYKI